jgi:hypothetical protein
MVRSFELSVLLTPAREAAYRASPQFGFTLQHGFPASPPPGALPAGSSPSAVVFLAHGESGLDASSVSVGASGQQGGGTVTVRLPVPYALPPLPYRPSGASAAQASGSAAGPPAARAADEAQGGEADTPWAVDQPQMGLDVFGLPWGVRRNLYGYLQDEEEWA